MLKLNLISKELKKEIKIKHLYSLIKKACLLFVFTAIFIGALFISSSVTLSKNFNYLKRQLNTKPINNQDYSDRIKKVNSKLKSIDSIQSKYIPYSYLLQTITNEISKEISIEYLKIDSINKTVMIKGIAKDRLSLIALKDNLKKLPILSGVELPLTNILEKQNINFAISAKLNTTKIPK